MKLIDRYKGLSGNTKTVFKNATGAFLVKGLGLFISLYTYPVYLEFFDNEVALGLWSTILSVLTWMLNFDFGIGNGLRNHLAAAIGEGNHKEGKKYVSSAYVSVGGVCLIALAVFLAVYRLVNWNKLFKIETSIVSREALFTAILIVFVGILLQMFLRIINSVLYAVQKSSVNNFLALCTSVLTLVTMLVVPGGSNDRNLICMAVVHALAVAIPQIVATVAIFCFSKYRDIAPSVRCVEKTHIRRVLSLGSSFLFVQTMYMLIMNTNEFLITRLVGSECVVEYSIYYRIFALGSTVFSLALTPIWSAVTKAIAEKDVRWVSSLYKKMLLLGAAGTFCEFLAVPILQFLINIWLQDKAISVNYGYAIAFAFMGSAMIFNGVLSSIANGLGKIKTQAVMFTVGMVLKIALSYVLVGWLGSWIGVLIANAAALAFYCVVEPWSLRKHLKHLSEQTAQE